MDLPLTRECAPAGAPRIPPGKGTARSARVQP